MADEMTDSPTGGGSKIAQFVRKNKTLTIVAAGAGIWYLIHKNNENSETAATTTNAEYSEEGATPANEIGSVNARQEYNELKEQEEERRREREAEEKNNKGETEHIEEENEENNHEGHAEKEPPEKGEPTEGPSSMPETPGNQSPGQSGWSAHGKEFAGATSGRIVKTGKQGEKSYVEYAITFPGHIEYWRYFTASGNWEKVDASNEGPATGHGGKGTGGGNPPVKAKPPIGIGEGVAVSHPPQTLEGHPNAVNTGNRCVGGGVGAHTAPDGYHLFCGSDGWIWRAPNESAPEKKKGGGGGGGGSTPAPVAPPAPPAPPQCDAGTIANIQSSRNEVNRLQGEINTLQGYISAHPNAKQVGEWRANIANKQATRDQFQGAVDRGHAQPGCAGV